MAERLLTRRQIRTEFASSTVSYNAQREIMVTLDAAFADLRLLMEATAHCPEDMVRTLAALRKRIHDRWAGTGWLDEEKP